MEGSFVSALVVAAVLGMLFATTRGLAIAAAALLAFIYKALAILVVVVVGVYLIYRFKTK